MGIATIPNNAPTSSEPGHLFVCPRDQNEQGVAGVADHPNSTSHARQRAISGQYDTDFDRSLNFVQFVNGDPVDDLGRGTGEFSGASRAFP